MRKFPSIALEKLRLWHRWLGIALSAFVLLLACTGLFMNHKDLFLGTPAPSASAAREKSHDGARGVKKSPLTAATDLAQLPVSFEQALALSAPILGEGTAVDSIQLKADHGALAYQIKTPRFANPEYEITVNASSGAVAVKKQTGYAIQNADGSIATDWGRLAIDLHTGRFFNREYGKWFISDPTAVALLLLTFSGLCMWLIPAWRKRKSS